MLQLLYSHHTKNFNWHKEFKRLYYRHRTRLHLYGTTLLCGDMADILPQRKNINYLLLGGNNMSYERNKQNSQIATVDDIANISFFSILTSQLPEWNRKRIADIERKSLSIPPKNMIEPIELPNHFFYEESFLCHVVTVLYRIRQEHPRAFKNLVKYSDPNSLFKDFKDSGRSFGYKTLLRKYGELFDENGEIREPIRMVVSFWPGYYYWVDGRFITFYDGSCTMRGDHRSDAWNRWVLSVIKQL